MGALLKACKSSTTVKNTGIECNDSMGPTAMLIAVPRTLKWTATNMVDFPAYLTPIIHGTKANRAYPLFGPDAPIRKITNNKEADVLVTLDDGTQLFIRYGVYNQLLETTEGGICYAQALQSFTRANFSVLVIDNTGQILMRKNSDGTFSGLKTTFMFAPSMDMADYKTPAFTKFQISFTPQEYVNFGEIFSGDQTILDLVGLLDASVSVGTAGASSTTKLKFVVTTDCGGTDLVAEFGSALAVLSNFVVVDHATGAAPTITAAAVVGNHIELTGTFVSTHTYDTSLAAPSVLLTNGVQGIEGTLPVGIIIP